MAKEADVKMIELKVSVGCCDGCKRKVKKALHSVEGVHKIEIDPSKTIVIVEGNVDPQHLVKKLLKAGKQAEITSEVQLNADNEDEEAAFSETPVKKKNRKPKSKSIPKKPSNSDLTTSDKSTEQESRNYTDYTSNEKERDEDANSGFQETSIEEHNQSTRSKIESTIYQNKMPEMITAGSYRQNPYTVESYRQNPYTVEPYAVAIPCYAVPSYITPLYPYPMMQYGQGHYPGDTPATMVATESADMQVGDYFSEENPVGCHVM